MPWYRVVRILIHSPNWSFKVVRWSGGERGFSLLEILVAVTIMGLAYVAILQNFSQSARNIHIMGETRSSLLENSLLFEKFLLSLDQMDENDVGDTAEVLVEGSRYQLSLVSDENNDFEILRLEKK